MGVELYGQVQFAPQLWFVGGYNYLKPDDEEALSAGRYALRKGILGFRYSVEEFAQMFYTEILFDNSRGELGSSFGNQVAVGIRWSF